MRVYPLEELQTFPGSADQTAMDTGWRRVLLSPTPALQSTLKA